MSGSMNPMSSVDELRRRVAIWSLAVFGSLTGSGTVRLESEAWATEDPPAEAKNSDERKDKPSASGAVIDRAVFQKLLADKDFDAAIKLIDEAQASEKNGNNIYMNYLLANAMVNAKHEAGLARMEEVRAQAQAAIKDTPQPMVLMAYTASHQSLATKLMSEQKSDEAIALIEKAIKELEDNQAGAQAVALQSMQVSLLIRSGRQDEAKALAVSRLDKAIANMKAENNSASRSLAGSAFSQFSSSLGSQFPEEVMKAHATIEPILLEVVKGESAKIADFSAYQSVQTGFATAMAEVDAKAASAALESTKALAEEFRDKLDDPTQQKQFSALQSSLLSTESRLRPSCCMPA